MITVPFSIDDPFIPNLLIVFIPPLSLNGLCFPGDQIGFSSFGLLGLHPWLFLLLIREVLVVWICWNGVLEADRVGGVHLVTGATGQGSKGSHGQ